MRKSVLVSVVFAVLLVAADVFAQQEVLLVENWVKVGEERQVLNKDFESGLVRRYYVDPDQKNGVGSTLSVFYKDGSEELFWKGWNLYTEKARVALLYQREFVLQPIQMQTTRNMRTLKDLTDYLVAKLSESQNLYYRDNTFYLPSLGICLVADKELNRLKSAKDGLSVCYTMLFERYARPLD